MAFADEPEGGVFCVYFCGGAEENFLGESGGGASDQAAIEPASGRFFGEIRHA